MWSGLVKSVKGMFGYEDLEVESGGTGEETAKVTNPDERKGLWKQLSSFIGQDITSMISLPVWIFEPLSFLQIMCEPMQYAHLLHKASNHPDSAHRLGYLAAFITAGYTCATRQKKPFNPILGETFEFIGEKFKFFAEQVSHHPPIGIAQAVSEDFVLELEMGLRTKFRGNSSDVFVDGTNRIHFTKSGETISWNHLDTCAHNVIIGGMWVDHFGTLELKNHTTGDKAVITFTKSGWLGSGRFQLGGNVVDAQGNVKLKIFGHWNEAVCGIKVEPDGTEGKPFAFWKVPEKTSLNKWGWPRFNEEMNAMNEDYKKILPPTDSRLRGDRLALEQDKLDLAGSEKQRLEEKQRAERKERNAKNETWVPQFFRQEEDAVLGKTWKYFGNYWEQREEKVKELGGEPTAQLTQSMSDVTLDDSKQDGGKQ